MRKLLITALMAIGLTAGVTAQQTYVVDSGFENFTWSGGVGTSSDQGGFEFTLATSGTLQVTDTFAFGDRFDIFVNAISVGQTSAVSNDSTTVANVGNDPFAAIAAGYSNASFALAAGAYTVDFALFQDALNSSGNPFSGGTAAFRVSTIPEPATWLMMIIGFAATGFAVRRRRQTSIA